MLRTGALSTTASFTISGLETKLTRNPRLLDSQDHKDKDPVRTIGISFSGGGLRASLFHLGVVRFFSEANLLGKTSRICSVSGGSVLAAHLVLNWEDYLSSKGADGKNPDPFFKASRELVRFARADVRGKILRRLFLYFVPRMVGLLNVNWAFRWSNTGRLQKFYDRLLFRKLELQGLVSTAQKPKPHLYLLATNLTRVDLCCFDHRVFQQALFSTQTLSDIPAQTLRIAYAVAASSCFPGFFGPLEVNKDTLSTTLERLGIERQQIADGGVFDNLGVRMLRVLNRAVDPCDLNIISDAGRSHTWETKMKFPHVVSTPLRASDVLMSRVGQLEKEAAAEMAAKDEYQFITIAPFSSDLKTQYDSSVLDKDPRTPEEIKSFHSVCYEQLPHVRTDFDKFSRVEIVALAQHGYLSARAALWPYRERLGINEAMFFHEPWNPLSGGYDVLRADEKLTETLKAGRKRIWGFWRFFVDPLACLPFVVAVLAIAALFISGKKAYFEHRAANYEKIINASTISAARSVRKHIIDVLRSRRKIDGFCGKYSSPETWTTCQAVGALCQALEVKREHLAEYVVMLTNRFVSYDFDKKSNAWSSDTFQTDGAGTNHFRGVTHSIPSLWFLNALSLAKQIDDKSPNRENQKDILNCFDMLQGTVTNFHDAGGGWWMYSKSKPEECNPFSTAYALFGMLEARKAGFDLFLSAASRDKAIADSVTWLREHFVGNSGTEGGWNENNGSDTPIRPGLTFQVWTALLRADRHGFHSDAKFLQRAAGFLAAYSTAHPSDFADQIDVGQFRSYPVHFAVVAWRIACCAEYVDFLKRTGTKATGRVIYEKILNDFVANLELPDSEAEPKTYLFALNLYALGRVLEQRE